MNTHAVKFGFPSNRARQLCRLLLLSPALAVAQAANDDSSVLEKVRGTVYVRSMPAESATGGRQCGFEFLVIARDPADGQAIQLKGSFVASQNEHGALYGWSGVLYDGLHPRQAGHPPARMALQPVNGMRIQQPQPVDRVGNESLQYRARIDSEFQVLMASIVRDRGLKLGFSTVPDGALIETMLDLDVSAMQFQQGNVMRQFDSRVPIQMSRCWGSSGS